MWESGGNGGWRVAGVEWGKLIFKSGLLRRGVVLKQVGGWGQCCLVGWSLKMGWWQYKSFE